METTCAAEVLSRKLGLGGLKKRDGFGGTLREVVEKYYDKEGFKEQREEDLEQQLGEMQSVIKEVFRGEGEYSQRELAEMMDLTEEELVERYMTRFPGSPQPFPFNLPPNICITPLSCHLRR